MTHRTILLLLITGLLLLSCESGRKEELPNIIYILADDLGYGDVSAFNSRAAWETPHIDRLAEEGASFTDAHSGSAVCTPTRYGVLTGRYSWRTRLKQGVLWSRDEALIDTSELTVAGLLKRNGYHTACIGKWHLGLGWKYHSGTGDSIDFSSPVTGGPADLGFDHFFGITASLDIPPYVYIEEDLPTSVPVSYTENESEYGWWRRGLTGEDFVHGEVLPVLTSRAASFIRDHVKERGPQPFFLYFPLPAPHTPILPAGEFLGRSGTNPYGDFVLQVDHTVGRILGILDSLGISGRTLVIFTSDNGCSPEANFPLLGQYGHDPSYHFRGHKADIYEGGHRVPLVTRWPGRIGAGTRNGRLTCLTDLMATVAEIVGDPLEEDEGVDSYSMFPEFRSPVSSEKGRRTSVVHHSVNGSFAIRSGPWKLIMCPGSGGWSDPRPGSEEAEHLPPFQLYHLEQDPAEQTNLWGEYPSLQDSLRSLLQHQIISGRSTPGPPQEYVKNENWPGTGWMGSD